MFNLWLGLQKSCIFGGLVWLVVVVLGFDLCLFGGLGLFCFCVEGFFIKLLERQFEIISPLLRKKGWFNILFQRESF